MNVCRLADDEERRKWQDPEAILAGIGLKPGFTFIDMGCGGGFFTLPAARIVGQSGMVYGIDTDIQLIKSLEKAAAEEGLANLVVTVGKAETVVICQKCADIVFFGIVLHDFENPTRVLENARIMLKLKGRIANLDWKKEPMKLGPPLYKRFSGDEAIGLINKAGFIVETVKDNGPYHYLIMAKPGI